jgi:hypothetical protein
VPVCIYHHLSTLSSTLPWPTDFFWGSAVGGETFARPAPIRLHAHTIVSTLPLKSVHWLAHVRTFTAGSKDSKAARPEPGPARLTSKPRDSHILQYISHGVPHKARQGAVKDTEIQWSRENITSMGLPSQSQLTATIEQFIRADPNHRTKSFGMTTATASCISMQKAHHSARPVSKYHSLLSSGQTPLIYSTAVSASGGLRIFRTHPTVSTTRAHCHRHDCRPTIYFCPPQPT